MGWQFDAHRVRQAARQPAGEHYSGAGISAVANVDLTASIRASTSPGVRCSRVRSSAFGRRVGVTVRASYPYPTLKNWCALNTTLPGQSRGRAGASPLTASPIVPACRPAYAADATCHWATRDNSIRTIGTPRRGARARTASASS
jgi:hypothetical protein